MGDRWRLLYYKTTVSPKIDMKTFWWPSCSVLRVHIMAVLFRIVCLTFVVLAGVIADPPRVQPFFLPENSELCDEINVMCTAKSASPLELQWLKNGEDVRTVKFPNATVSQVGNILLLSVKCISGVHAGNYSCVAKNRYGEDSFTAALRISAAPFWLDDVAGYQQHTVKVSRGKTVEFRCSPGGFPKPNVTWYKGGLWM